MDIGQNASDDSIARLMADLQPAEPEQAGALEEARQLAAQALENGLAHRRPVPLTTNLAASAVPDWANGLKASRSLGPFKDLANRDIWIDLFPIVRHIRLVRVAGGIPFMTLPIQIIIPFPFPPPPTPTLDVPSGSVWFASQLLDAPRADTGTATWSETEIEHMLGLLGLSPDTPLSCLVVETLPGEQPVADPVGSGLGYERFLRTSPLTAVPAQC